MSQPLELSDLVPGIRLGHYVISSRIAQGGVGTVFKALEPALERYVAIKVLRPEYSSNPAFVQYFQEEARAVAALRHPNIVPIFFIGEEGNVVFFSMAYIEGETFDDWIEKRRWFNLEQARWFLSHAIAALHAAHKENIVHLDIKPANFLVDRANNIMLTDFGLAQRIIKEGAEEGERSAFGTPAYVSPEQINRSPTDQRTDIYSLGATLFHLMTGRPPFEAPIVEDIVWGHLDKPFPIEVAEAAQLPTGWIHLIRKMMARAPEDRFQDYRALRAALENVQTFRVETGPLAEPRPNRPQAVPREGSNPPTLHGLLAATKTPWTAKEAQIGSAIAITPEQVRESMKTRLEPLKVEALLTTLRDLCQPATEDAAILTQAMEQVPGYRKAVFALADFMEGRVGDDHRGEEDDPLQAIETVGAGRSRNLALTFFALNYEYPNPTHFDWKPLWQHQVAVGVVLDFLYDALSLRRSGLEYVAGFTHDIGKLILAEIFPFAYFSTLTRALQEGAQLRETETSIFGLDHATIGAEWLKLRGLPHPLVEAVAQHEAPDAFPRRALLGHALISANQLVKQIGIGYSGNPMLDPRPWEELPSTAALWEARGQKTYEFTDFARDILVQFESFPDLV